MVCLGNRGGIVRRAQLITGKADPLFVAASAQAQGTVEGAITYNIPSHNPGDFAILWRVGATATNATPFSTPTGYTYVDTTMSSGSTTGIKVSKFTKILGSETTVSLNAISGSDSTTGGMALMTIYRNITGIAGYNGQTVNTTTSTTQNFPDLITLAPTVSVFIGYTQASLPSMVATTTRTSRAVGWQASSGWYTPFQIAGLLKPTTTSVAESPAIGATTQGQVTQNIQLIPA